MKPVVKPVIELKGNLAYEPVIGERVMILQDGSPKYYTSTLMAVHNRKKSGIELETRNTIYKITYEKRKKAKKAA